MLYLNHWFTKYSRPLSMILSVFSLSFFLSGCGLHPMLAERTPSETPQKFLLKVTGSGYGAYQIRREVEKHLAAIPKQSESPYTISVSYTESSTSMGYGRDATVVRSQNTAIGHFQISHQGEIIGAGTAEGISSYSLNYVEEFSSRSALTAAQERAIVVLAEELTKEILMAIHTPKKLIPKESVVVIKPKEPC